MLQVHYKLQILKKLKHKKNIAIAEKCRLGIAHVIIVLR